MKFEDLSEEEILELEKSLLQKANDFFIKLYGNAEATDVDKLRLLSRQGRIQDTLQHDIMTNYFKKRGLWRDGKTTHEERKEILAKKKKEFGYKIEQIRNAKIKNMNDIIKKAQEKKEALKKIPIQLHEEYKINKQEILETLIANLEELFQIAEDTIDKEIGDRYNEFISKITTRKDEVIDNAKSKILNLHKAAKMRLQSEVEQFSSELEAELVVQEYADKDDLLIEDYNEQIREINQELNELNTLTSKEIEAEPEEEYEEVEATPQGLEALLKKDLLKIADSEGIPYTSRTTKAELIKLLTE